MGKLRTALAVALLSLLLPTEKAEAGGSDTLKIMVPVRGQNMHTRAGLTGATLLAVRGSYAVYSIPGSQLSDLSSDPLIRPRPDFDRIYLHRGIIDTRLAPAGSPVRDRPVDEGRRLKLVQFSAPPVDADIRLLTAAGVRIVQYIPQNAYLLWSEPGGGERLRRLKQSNGGIQFLADYLPDYALSPRLDGVLEKRAPVDVTVQFFNYGPEAMDAAALLAAGARRVITPPGEASGGRYVNLRVAVPGSDLMGVASLPGVVWVEPYLSPRLHGERQDQIMAGNLAVGEHQPSGPGYLTWLQGLSFPTIPDEYPIVDVVDDGFDNGNASSPANSEFRELNIAANLSRVQYAQIAPGSSGVSSAAGIDGHGNLNCSIVGGYNNGAGTPPNLDSGLYAYGLGVSPYGRIASTKVFDDAGAWAGPDEETMIDDQYTAGVRISNNSWGTSVSGDYDVDAQNYDGWTRDARGGTTGNQEMLFIFSAGNDGPSSGSVDSPGTAKNVIAVGASENYNQTGTDGCGTTNLEADDIQDIAGFSSRGPCDDSRVKPDIVGPGTHIQGAASYDASYTGIAVCDKYSPLGQTKYCLSSGTSHSAPAISGAISLIWNFLDRVYSVDSPSPALLKAYLIHAGRHLTGTSANDNLPSNSQGFGLVNLDFAFDQSASRYLLDQTTVFQSSGESYQFTSVIDDSSQPLRVVLAWTDAPGPVSGNAYVNDLDLEVSVGGVLYRGNNFSKGVSQTGGSADPRNNVEAVFLAAGSTGEVAVTVRGTTISGDGVPGNGDTTDQDFALVVYNAAAPVETAVLDSGDYDGDETSDIAIFRDSSGLWAVRAVTRVYFGTSSDLPAGGDYDGDGSTDIALYRGSTGLWAVRGVTRVYFGGSSDIPVPGDYNGDGSCEAGIFRESSGLWALRGVSRIYFGTSSDSPVPGYYDGDGTKEVGIFRGSSGLWALRDVSRIYFGAASDTPSTGDYDGDGSWEVGIFRESSGLWALRGVSRIYFGGSSDLPVPADYNGDGITEVGIFRGSSGLWALRDVSRIYFGGSGDIPVSR